MNDKKYVEKILNDKKNVDKMLNDKNKVECKLLYFQSVAVVNYCWRLFCIFHVLLETNRSQESNFLPLKPHYFPCNFVKQMEKSFESFGK